MKTVLEAGYYHLKQTPQDISENGLTIKGEKDTAFLLKLNPRKTLLDDSRISEKISFIDPADKVSSYALIKLVPSESLSISKDIVQSAVKIDYSPTAAQKRTLEYALENYSNKADNIVITVDDLGLPSPIFKHLHSLIPKDYIEMIGKTNLGTPILVSERRSRNYSKYVDKKIGLINHKSNAFQDIYEKSGFLVAQINNQTSGKVTKCSDGNLVLCSRSAIDEKPDGKDGSVVALTRLSDDNRNVPSCGVVNAGRLNEIAKSGCEHIITVDHTDDDPNVRYKNFDGAVVAAWCDPNIKLKLTNITMSDRGNNKEQIITDYYDFAELRNHDSLTIGELISDLKTKLHDVSPIKDGRGITISKINSNVLDNTTQRKL